MENEVEEYSHVLEGRSHEVLHLCQGENWLRLVISAGGLDLLADTQDDDLDGVPNPSIISLEEVGSVQWPTEDCYICIDLDGESAAIKDMRNITDQDPGGFVVCLQKRLNALMDDDESGDDNDDDAYGRLEELPRRQLRLIYSGDRVCTLTTKPTTADEPTQDECIGHLGLVLTYRRCRGSGKYKYSNTQASQFTTMSALDIPCASLRDAMSTQDSHETTTDMTESQLRRSIESSLRPGAIQSEESVVDDIDVELDDDGEQTQLIPFATQEEDGPTVEDALREMPQVKSSISENNDPTEGNVSRTDLLTKEVAPSLSNAPAISNETQLGVGNGMVVDAGGRGASSVADCSGEHDECSGNPCHDYLVGDEENDTPGRHSDRGIRPDESIRECVTAGNKLRQIETSQINALEPHGDHTAALKEQLGNIPADATSSCRHRLDAHQLSCQSPARDDFDDETVLDAPRDAASSVCTGRFEEPTQSLPFSFAGVTDKNSTEVPSAIERIGRPFSDHEKAEQLHSTEVQYTLSVDFEGPVDDDESESTALTDVDDENRQGTSNIQQDVENLNTKDEEEVLDDPEHVAVGPFSPRSQATRARSVVESANCSRTDIGEDNFGSGGNEPDTTTLSNTSAKRSDAKVGDSISGRESPMSNIASSIRRPFTVPDTNLEFYSHTASGAMEGTDKDSRIEPTAAPYEETDTRSGSSRKRAVRDLPPSAEGEPKTRSFRRTQGLDTASDEKLSSNFIGSRKRQRRESQNINVLVTGVSITARHRSKIKAIGGKILESAAQAIDATHVIASDGVGSIRRTPKLMIALCKTSNIVSMKWLDDSARKRKPLATTDYLVLDDVEAETKYRFNMRRTLQNGDSLRQCGETIFNGRHVFVCNGVAGKKAPPEDELKQIVAAAGGKWISDASRLLHFRAENAMIITSDPPAKGQLSTKYVANAIKVGIRHYSTSWLFNSLLCQELKDD